MKPKSNIVRVSHGAFRAKNQEIYEEINPRDFLKTNEVGYGANKLGIKYSVSKNTIIQWRAQIQAAFKEFCKGDFGEIERRAKEIIRLYYTTNILEFRKALGGIGKPAARGIILILRAKGLMASREELIKEYVAKNPNVTPEKLTLLFGLTRKTAQSYIAAQRKGPILTYLEEHQTATREKIVQMFGVNNYIASQLISGFRNQKR